ncbi:cytoplasmic protein [Kwoniella heveanensis CBS 569]|nr:cytoplasmic protein [Kwoniella heveanensis CBS 569]
MCGLTLTIRPLPASSTKPEERNAAIPALLDSFRSTNTQRGPDSQRSHTEIVDLDNGRQVEVVLNATVLGLRGELTAQPMIGKRGVLGWNGQVFEGIDVQKDENDTRKLFERLEAGEEPEEILRGVEGPFAFIYLDLVTQTVHYQLDPLSRRSLLIHPVDDTTYSHTEYLILSSSRSTSAREQGIDMRALLGGEGGTIRLKDIIVQTAENGLEINLDRAMNQHSTLHQAESSSSAATFTRVTSINSFIPSHEPPFNNPAVEAEVSRFIDHLRTSVRKRVENIPDPEPGQARVAVLFSGGIDCTFLAYLLHDCLPLSDPIDLINVAFSTAPKTLNPNDKGKGKALPLPTYDVPDRLSGRDAVAELRQVCVGREWRFVEVNVPYEETQAHRQRVLDLMYPSGTEMDLSLALPLYFASRGLGTLEGSGEAYQVRAKVYISGLGADEQLGGYARHRHAFQRGGWPGLVDETQMDISRLPTRNLSRDDRLISSFARDARYPYLSLSFISYLSSSPIHLKVDPRMKEGQGDKLLLRKAVRSVGLMRASERVKRAMQFGTRSSKVGGSGSGVKGPKAGERLVE